MDAAGRTVEVFSEGDAKLWLYLRWQADGRDMTCELEDESPEVVEMVRTLYAVDTGEEPA